MRGYVFYVPKTGRERSGSVRGDPPRAGGSLNDRSGTDGTEHKGGTFTRPQPLITVRGHPLAYKVRKWALHEKKGEMASVYVAKAD